MSRSIPMPRRDHAAAPWHRMRRVCGAVVVLAGLISSHAVAQTSASSKAERVLRILQTDHRDAQQRLADALEKIAQTCEARQLETTAAKIRRIAQPSDPQVLRFEPLPRSAQPPFPADLPEDELEWRVQLREKRKNYAGKLDELATRSVKAGFPSYAYQLVREAAFHDPDHPRARRLLGFVRFGDEWVSPFEADKLKKNEVLTEQFGWLPAAHVPHYQQGERPHPTQPGRWIASDVEAELRGDFRRAWQVRTEHYLLRTNVSLERGVALATALEDFHQFFQYTFAAFFTNAEQLQRMFLEKANAAARPLPKPFEVHFYRSQNEYITRLKDKPYGPQIAITNGVYDTDDRIVYSFHNPDSSPETTLYHEATHQLLAALLRDKSPIATRANFWLVEGIACYIESFQRQEGRVSLGDPRSIRFEAARYRLLADKYYLPLTEFTAMGKDAFQSHRQIQNNYSQAAGLVHFFMHYDESRYRDDLIEHLRQIYQQAEQPRLRVNTLAELTGVDFVELDAQYEDYSRKLSGALGERFQAP